MPRTTPSFFVRLMRIHYIAIRRVHFCGITARRGRSLADNEVNTARILIQHARRLCRTAIGVATNQNLLAEVVTVMPNPYFRVQLTTKILGHVAWRAWLDFSEIFRKRPDYRPCPSRTVPRDPPHYRIPTLAACF